MLNSLKTALLHEFLPMLDINFKNLICSSSHTKFSSKSFNKKSVLLIFEDNMFTVPKFSHPYVAICSTVYSKRVH